MIDIRAHTKTDYAVLPNIDSPAMEALDDSDWECLDEIGGLLIAKGANDRFGVTLLHSHFPIGDNEIIVEEPRPFERAFTLARSRIARRALTIALRSTWNFAAVATIAPFR